LLDVVPLALAVTEIRSEDNNDIFSEKMQQFKKATDVSKRVALHARSESMGQF
jgi:hypothetical protein